MATTERGGGGTEAQIEAFLLGRGGGDAAVRNEANGGEPKSPPKPLASVGQPGEGPGAPATRTAARSRWSDWRASATARGDEVAGMPGDDLGGGSASRPIDDGGGAAGGPRRAQRGQSYWDDQYSALEEHYRRNGVGARLSTAQKNLGKWKDELEETKIKLLRDIGFDFKGHHERIKDKREHEWKKRLGELAEILDRPEGEPPKCSRREILRRIKWLKKGTLEGPKQTPCAHKVRMLKRVKRSWGGRTDKEIAEDVWEEHFERLEAYSKNNGGDANILWDGKNGDNGLWEWVKEQRQAYGRRTNKKISRPLSDERMARLEAIGLDLSEKAIPRWDKMYADLVDYKEKHGDCYVPYHYKSEGHGNLGVWVCSQKVTKREGQMSSAKELKVSAL
ncbi:hypothetical protein ACHAWF_002073 [Thalassiosira exigua]